MKYLYYLMIVVFSFGAFSCDDSDNISAMSLDDYAENQSELFCGKVFECCAHAKYYNDFEDCKTVEKENILTTFNGKQWEIDTGQVSLCYNAQVEYHNVECADPLKGDDVRQPCFDGFTIGIVDEGGDCDYDDECMNDMQCAQVDIGFSKVCKPLSKLDEGCSIVIYCDAHLVCNVDVCVAALGEGEDCTANPYWCDNVEGLFCNDSSQCEKPRANGEDCDFSFHCISGHCESTTQKCETYATTMTFFELHCIDK
jgi:hypothetical protein